MSRKELEEYALMLRTNLLLAQSKISEYENKIITQRKLLDQYRREKLKGESNQNHKAKKVQTKPAPSPTKEGNSFQGKEMTRSMRVNASNLQANENNLNKTSKALLSSTRKVIWVLLKPCFHKWLHWFYSQSIRRLKPDAELVMSSNPGKAATLKLRRTLSRVTTTSTWKCLNFLFRKLDMFTALPCWHLTKLQQVYCGNIFGICANSVVGCGDMYIHVWDLKTCSHTSTWKGHTGDVRALAKLNNMVWLTN